MEELQFLFDDLKKFPLDLKDVSDIEPLHEESGWAKYTAEIIEAHRKACQIAANRRVKQGTHNFQTHGHIYNNLDHVRESRRQRMKGNVLGSLRQITIEFRQKQAEGSKGNTNVRGKCWWFKGNEKRRSKGHPGEGWQKGFKPY